MHLISLDCSPARPRPHPRFDGQFYPWYYCPVQSDNPQPAALQRIRLTFAKQGPARFISHLDLSRAIERALNRARLPMAYSQGFNRRVRLSLAAALPLGYTGEAELADVWLVESMDTDTFFQRLSPKMPPGIRLHHVQEVPLQSPSLPQQVLASSYEVSFLDPFDLASMRSKVETLLAASTWPAMKHSRKRAKVRPFDLRPLIIALEIENRMDEEPRLLMRLKQTSEQTGRPDDVLAALGLDPLDAHVHRRAIVLVDAG